jgi:hypothetical protein
MKFEASLTLAVDCGRMLGTRPNSVCELRVRVAQFVMVVRFERRTFSITYVFSVSLGVPNPSPSATKSAQAFLCSTLPLKRCFSAA